ncbi:MAG: cell division protein FtsA [Candidatus Sungbacteria bacterium]|nr:cell division protein FtsA [Candidatus Sungbacteria bacterium]
MARNIIVALDIGTSTVETVIAETIRGEDAPRILGVGVVPSQGVRKGVVIDLGEVMISIRRSVEEARKSSGVPVRSVWLAVGGSHVSVSSSRGVVAVSRADGEISPEDVRRVISAAESFVAKNPNKELLHIIPRDFRVDNESGIKDPVGMHGVRLEVDTLIVECSAPFLKNILKCVEGAGFAVEDYVFSPLAAARAVLTKRQKELGVMLLDVGGGTASFVVYEEGVPLHAGVVPIGGGHITNDVAIGFRTHVDIAEEIKKMYGSCLPDEFSKRDTVRLAEFLPEDQNALQGKTAEGISYPRRELAEIVSARLQDLFEVLHKELKKAGRSGLLPAGVILVGGTSLLPGLAEVTKRELKLPVELGRLQDFYEGVDEKTAPVLATALGMVQWAHWKTCEPEGATFTDKVRHVNKHPFMKWLRSLLP